MAVVITVLTFVILGCLALLRPRMGLVLLWLTAWLYPNTLLYGTLPLNVRFDDLWVVFIFLVALASPRRGMGLRPVTWLAILWMLSIMMGNVAGVLTSGTAAWEAVVKSSTKALYVPMTTFAMATFLVNERHLHTHIWWLLVGGALAGLLGIATVFAPTAVEPFLIPRHELGSWASRAIEEAAVERRRAVGAVGVMALAGITVQVALLGLAVFAAGGGLTHLALPAVASLTCLAALGYTASRGPIIGLLCALVAGIFLTPRRKVFIAAIVLATIVAIAQGGVLDRVLARLTTGVGLSDAGLRAGLETRMEVWSTLLEQLSLGDVLLGQGMAITHAETGVTAHNSYIGAFAYGGLLGAVTLVAVLAYAWVLARRLLATAKDSLSRAIGSHMLMATVAIMIAGIALECLQGVRWMQLFFAAMVLTQRRIEQVAPSATFAAADGAAGYPVSFGPPG